MAGQLVGVQRVFVIQLEPTGQLGSPREAPSVQAAPRAGGPTPRRYHEGARPEQGDRRSPSSPFIPTLDPRRAPSPRPVPHAQSDAFPFTNTRGPHARFNAGRRRVELLSVDLAPRGASHRRGCRAPAASHLLRAVLRRGNVRRAMVRGVRDATTTEAPRRGGGWGRRRGARRDVKGNQTGCDDDR